MTTYKRLNLEERERIHALVNQGKTNREIAASLNRSHTTISRELQRCGTKFEYSPSKADKHDDILLSEYPSLSIVNNHHISKVPQKLKDAKYQFIKSRITNIIDHIDSGKINIQKYPAFQGFPLIHF